MSLSTVSQYSVERTGDDFLKLWKHSLLRPSWAQIWADEISGLKTSDILCIGFGTVLLTYGKLYWLSNSQSLDINTDSAIHRAKQFPRKIALRKVSRS